MYLQIRSRRIALPEGLCWGKIVQFDDIRTRKFAKFISKFSYPEILRLEVREFFIRNFRIFRIVKFIICKQNIVRVCSQKCSRASEFGVVRESFHARRSQRILFRLVWDLAEATRVEDGVDHNLAPFEKFLKGRRYLGSQGANSKKFEIRPVKRSKCPGEGLDIGCKIQVRARQWIWNRWQKVLRHHETGDLSLCFWMMIIHCHWPSMRTLMAGNWD